MVNKIEPTELQGRLPQCLDDVALLDVSDVCQAARISRSHFFAEVQAGRGPKALRFGARCTRYRLTDVRAWLTARATSAEADTASTDLVRARATRATRARQVYLAAGSPRGRRVDVDLPK